MADGDNIYLDKVMIKDKSFSDIAPNAVVIDRDEIDGRGISGAIDLFKGNAFIGVSNRGLGEVIDMRGQGDKANTSVLQMLNGVRLNSIDAAHGTTPLGAIGSDDIERIEIIPGGGAVMYGTGTRGGVVNIITKRRYKGIKGNVGIKYVNTPGGNKFASGYFGASDTALSVKLGGGNEDFGLSGFGTYIYNASPRDKDYSYGGTIALNIYAKLADEVDLSLDVNYSNIFERTTTALTGDNETIMYKRYEAGQPAPQRGRGPSVSPDIKDGLETITASADLNIYDASINLYFNRIISQGQIKPKVSFFHNTRGGIDLRYLYSHGENDLSKLRLGLEFNINQAHIYSNDKSNYMPIRITTALYALENYVFNEDFSLIAGLRLDVSKYQGFRKTSGSPMARTVSPLKYGKTNLTYFNVAAELTPEFHLDKDNSIYFKAELGFENPSPFQLLNDNVDPKTGYLYNARVKPEIYETIELGARGEGRGESYSIFYSAAVFYTLTQNEIYNLSQSAKSKDPMDTKYGAYKLTGRAGIEVSLEETLGDMVRLTQSATYIDARIMKSDNKETKLSKNDFIPYVPNFKATLGVHLDLGSVIGLWTKGIFHSRIYPARGTAGGTQARAPFYLLDFGMDLNTPHGFKLALGVRNALDHLYLLPNSTYASEPGVGRQFFVEGRYAL